MTNWRKSAFFRHQPSFLTLFLFPWFHSESGFDAAGPWMRRIHRTSGVLWPAVRWKMSPSAGRWASLLLLDLPRMIKCFRFITNSFLEWITWRVFILKARSFQQSIGESARDQFSRKMESLNFRHRTFLTLKHLLQSFDHMQTFIVVLGESAAFPEQRAAWFLQKSAADRLC